MNNKTFKFKELISEENKRVAGQREQRKKQGIEIFNEEKLMGLSISGGGIRSASFALGLLQSLNGVEIKSDRKNTKPGKVMEQLDYLSTVSGGGYVGSALTWFNQQNASGSAFYFPFGKKYVGARSSRDGDVLSFIRQHGNYLIPGSGLSFFSALMVVLRGLVVPFIVYLTLLVSGFYLFIAGNLFEPSGRWFGPSWIEFPNLLLGISAAAALLFLLFSFLYALGSFLVPLLSSGKIRDYLARVRVQKGLGRLGLLIVVTLLIGSVPLFATAIGNFIDAKLAGGGASLLGVLGGAFQYSQQQKGKTSGSFGGLRVMLTCILLIYGFAVLAYAVADQIDTFNMAMFAALGSFILLTGLFVNLNYFSLGRMYRDRLAETFLPNRDAVQTNQWQPATESDGTKLTDVNGDAQQGPYHLINTNVILTDAKASKFRGRGGDNFILSPIACGSNATRGWLSTDEFDHGNMTLATAMAISGAAANPHTGPSGGGLTRSKAVSFLMFLLGVRLGYYVANPHREVSDARRGIARVFKPNYYYPGIYQGLLGSGFDTSAGYLELSDGGHFENLGLYELIRRQVDLIIVSDGGADPAFSFQDLANAVEKVRVDFGVIIKFDDGDYDLTHLMPGSAGDGLFVERYALAARGFAIGQIYYDGENGQVGTLLYVKTTMTKDLPADIYGYKDAHQSFPDQSTADQFFDEIQFEAYRELGYRIGKTMLQDAQVQNIFAKY